jgi:integrase
MTSRALTPNEERALVRYCRKLSARNRVLVLTGLFTGFRISEVLALKISDVLHEGRIREFISLPPRFLKGGYGGSRSIPVANELQRALEDYIMERAKTEVLEPDAPLFVSRNHAPAVRRRVSAAARRKSC